MKKFKKNYNKQLFIIIYSSILLACAGNQDGTRGDESRRSDCIYESSVRGYVVLDESNLIIEGSARRKYHMVLRRRAVGLRSTWGIAFDSPTSSICSYSEVLFKGQFGGESIPISSIRQISPEEEEDLLIRFGKKEPEIKTTPAPAETTGAEIEELDPGATDDSSGD